MAAVALLTAGILGLPQPVGADQRFDELGMDSLLSLDLNRALQVHFGQALPENFINLCPTPRLVAEFLTQGRAK